MYTDLDFKAFKKQAKKLVGKDCPDDFYLRLFDLTDFAFRQWVPLLAQVMEKET